MPLTPQQLYEQTLVVRSQIGDERAFEELLLLFGPRLLLFTRKMMNAWPERIDDVMQEIWLAIFRGLPTLRDVTKFGPWAFRIARDRIYREYRRHKVPTHSIDDLQPEQLPVTEEPEAPIDLEEVQRCLNILSPAHREVLLLRFFEGMSYEDIARLTGSSIGTVRSRVHYGKHALKKAWEGKPL